MYKRNIDILKSKSFFLFGARGTGKSTLLKEILPINDCIWVDILIPEEEELFSNYPSALSERISSNKKLPEWIVIDEVQKVPKLLNVVHYEIENRNLKFALTGSSARKLKKDGVNLLAGRALVNHLYPLTFTELGDDFNLIETLMWGTLPSVVNSNEDRERRGILNAYVNTYLKEEIAQEQLIRNLVPFRKFIRIAAQSSGTLLNFNKIAEDLKIDWATVRNYFEILEDTLIGFMLPPYERSLRKQQLKSSKFYIFDTGVKRALDKMLTVHLSTNQMIGPLFEHYIIAELFRLNSYLGKDYSFSYLATKGGLEIDLVIERPGLPTALVEIKSSDQVLERHLTNLKTLKKEYPEYDTICLCREKYPRDKEGIKIMPWQDGIVLLGLA